jgi:hypothetical protein
MEVVKEDSLITTVLLIRAFGEKRESTETT